MKKFLLFFAVVGLCFSGAAQSLDLGVKAGINFANITDASGLENRTGFVAGGFVGARFNERLGLQADLLYSQQGAEFNAGDFDLTYVNVPIVLKIYLIDGLNLQAGPQFGILVDEESRTVLGETINDIATKDYDLTGVVGLGLDVPMGLRAEARYGFGLSNVFEGDQAGYSSGKNSVVTLSLGYSFL
ncbi:MAG: porin family protein [Marinirhabdus sp.]